MEFPSSVPIAVANPNVLKWKLMQKAQQSIAAILNKDVKRKVVLFIVKPNFYIYDTIITQRNLFVNKKAGINPAFLNRKGKS